MRRSSRGLVDNFDSVRDALVCVSKSEAGGRDGLDGGEEEDDQKLTHVSCTSVRARQGGREE